jgi:transposase InsO family protein
MELGQMDTVGGFLLADGTSAKALTGVDDHSRFLYLGKTHASGADTVGLRRFHRGVEAYGAPEQVLTDNGKVFTGKYSHPPVEVLFDRICRLNGVEHLLTQPRSPTTTGKIERFHRTLRVEFDTRQMFRNLTVAQAALDEWVAFYTPAGPINRSAMPRRRAASDQPLGRCCPSARANSG